jgi:molybdenum cofactor cytidylyltransferase
MEGNMTRKFVSGLILAAGSSRRLGQPKQLLPYQGTILLDWTLAQAEAAQGLDEVIVVLGQAADAIRPRLRATRAQVLISASFAEGCSGSYKTGMGALDPRADAVMILLGDQPGVDTTIINQVAQDWRAQGGSIALTSYRGHPGHPMVFAGTLFERLLQLQGDKAAWKILDAHPEWVRHVELDRAFPEDVDTWQDYEALLRQTTAPGS